MWVYRLGAEKAKRMLLTGDLIDGGTAKAYGLVIDAVPADDLDAHTEALIARITLNRPEHLNAITDTLPDALKRAVERANWDEEVHVIALSGAGRAFCAGYDLKIYAEAKRPVKGSQDMPWDPLVDYQWMRHCTDCYFSLWRSLKPVVTKIHGYAVAGGSDIALCSDLVVMAEDARIGYPPARIWGCPPRRCGCIA